MTELSRSKTTTIVTRTDKENCDNYEEATAKRIAEIDRIIKIVDEKIASPSSHQFYLKQGRLLATERFRVC